MQNKSPDAFRTISEVAEDLDIPQHVLRFWETRFSPIRPLKRGGGRRYYRPDDVELLRGIRHLLYGQGYTIKGVQRILKERGARFVQGVGRGEPADPPPFAPALESEADETDRAAFEHDEDHDEDRTVRPDEDRRGGVSAGPGRYDEIVIGRSGLGEADAGRLRAALDDLVECRRILAGLRAG